MYMYVINVYYLEGAGEATREAVWGIGFTQPSDLSSPLGRARLPCKAPSLSEIRRGPVAHPDMHLRVLHTSTPHQPKPLRDFCYWEVWEG